MVIISKNELEEPILISTTTIALLKLFLEKPTKEHTILELSKETKINYRQIYEQVIKYAQDGTLSITQRGHSKVCKINLAKHPGLYSFIESIRASEFIKKNPQFNVILNSLAKTSTKYYTLLVFGSYAKGENTKNSDIDLLFIVPYTEDTEKITLEIKSKLKLLNYKIDVNIINESDFINLKNEKSINIRNQVLDNHIILYGAENYYRFII